MRIKQIDDTVVFDNGAVLSYFHDQDCCEYVEADFSYLKVPNYPYSIYDEYFDDDLVIKKVDNIGFCLVGITGNKWLVPCYNVQNGYYNDALDLIFEAPGKEKVVIDVSDCTSEEEYDDSQEALLKEALALFPFEEV
jgi:hypothetical protein